MISGMASKEGFSLANLNQFYSILLNLTKLKSQRQQRASLLSWPRFAKKDSFLYILVDPGDKIDYQSRLFSSDERYHFAASRIFRAPRIDKDKYMSLLYF